MRSRTEPRRRRPIRGLALLAAALAPLACAQEGPVTAGGGRPPDAPVSQGAITASLNRYVESGPAEPFEKFSVTGLFPRYGRSGKKLVESLMEGRVPQSDAAFDQCAAPSPVVRGKPRRMGAVQGTEIELVDVGDMSIELDGRKTALPTQTFPDLLRVIDGVTYGADDAMGAVFAPARTYTIRASGSDEVPGFDVSLDAPEDLGEITVGGVSPAEQIPVVRRGEPLEITWEGGGGYGDEVFAEIRWSGAGLALSMDCRMRDDGRFTVPREMTAAMRDPLIAGEAEMTLSRVRQTAFRAGGLDSGDFSFVLSTSFLVRFEAVP